MNALFTRLLVPLAVASLLGCQSTVKRASAAVVMDPHSYSEPARVRVTHVSLDLDLDFDAGLARGGVQLDLDRTDSEAPLVLDVDGLRIHGVFGADGQPRSYALGSERDGLGVPLTIELAAHDERIRVDYETTRGSEAMQWLAPEQTDGGVHPFLFTQGQSILTRSWIPLQDSPGVRVTYDARVRAPEPLTVVMSAQQLGRDDSGAWRFRLDQAIPPYLIAMACGDLASRDVSDRVAIWAEPGVVERAANEFADTEAMVQSAEELFGPYRWGRYDVIILPPAFPFGGMENPLLTFATPTVIAGDRSLVALIAHELAHSWSGNLVTNATWRDFWLNEGFTVYFEKRIMEQVFGAERARMERMLDFDDLRREVAKMEAWETVLHIDLEGRHPDDGFSGVPYEKGALFLRRLEEVFGRERLDAFLRSWFDEHAFTSVTTEHFEGFLERELLSKHPALAAEVDVQRWLHEPGIPGDAPVPESDALTRVEEQITRWRGGAAPAELDADGWVTQQWLHFIGSLPGDLSPEDMAALDGAFAFKDSGNSEILFAWLKRSIRHGYHAADQRLEDFLLTVGRRKFLSPLYEELAKTDEGLARAKEIYATARPRYHAVSSGSIDKILASAEGR